MTNICIHGHFYQPPRENPWTGEIELQPGAAPFHDWNERILSECYEPNSHAEIFNDTGETVARINNFGKISFNFGPTLLKWIRDKHPETYEAIIEADRVSTTEHNGHGNAIAMCYNHMIMPLANRRDKVTQVKWGLRDFHSHFGRASEGIWLPETAVNTETIEVLINEGVRFIILDPGQARSARRFGKKEWEDVSAGTIDPGMPYRALSDDGGYIDIFFYDGPVSKAVAFDDVLMSSQNLVNKINAAAGPAASPDRLVSLATDGETFGHHKKFTERTLAHFLAVLAPANNFRVVNFGEFLEKNEPSFEVRIKEGENGEGTSWSCIHGVKRWEDDCGCGRTNGTNQKWRKPLRESLDWLRDKLITVYEGSGSRYFKNVWDARNDYIDLMIQEDEKTAANFFGKHAPRILSLKEIDTCYALLEMQKYAMFMYTSCGWFFSDISGIETVKILEYAARAIELAEKISEISLEDGFRERLSVAKSSFEEYGDGKKIYDKISKSL